MKKSQNKIFRIYKHNKKISEVGIFLALFWALGYTFAFVPNIEFITLITFLAGLLFGLARGLIVAIIGEIVFTTLNPFGSSLAFPPLLISQIFGFTIFAIIGFSFRSIIQYFPNNKIKFSILLGVVGFLLTLIYDSLTTLAFPIASGFDFKQIIATYIVGIPFSTIHIVANTLIFFMILPKILEYVIEHSPQYFSFTESVDENI
ncbi:MAG: ECF transporter S component [Candidatus Marinimicrobia bacterium]|nr:ECF transporter S component [Candidatus Neomarinimicrobiota bacterium]